MGAVSLQAVTVTIQPNAGFQSAVQIVMISGSSTHFTAAGTALSFGPGVTVSSIFVSGPTELEAGISVAANAPAGSHTVTITTGAEIVTTSYTVQAAPRALQSLSINAAAPGASNVTVQLQGTATGWVNGKTVASFGPGISVGGAVSGTAGPVTVTSSTTATAVLSVDPAATLSTRTVAVQTGAEIETAPNAFTVQTCGSFPAIPTIPYPPNIPINGLVQIPFSAPLNRSSVTANTFNLAFYYPQKNIPATATLDVTGTVLTLSPTGVLPVDDGYQVQPSTGSVNDACGLTVSFPLGGTSSTFQPAGLQIVTTDPIPGQNNFVASNLAFAFNQPVLLGSLVSGLSVTSAAGPVAGTFSLPSPSRALFTPNTALTPNTAYTITYTQAITNAAGALLTNPSSFTFTTGSAGSASYPALTLSPAGTTNVPTNMRGTLDSSLPFDPTTIDSSSLIITDLVTGTAVPAVVSLTNNLLTLSAKPNTPLQPNRSYNIAAPAWNLSSNFTTGAGAVTQPLSVALLSPANKADAVPLNAIVDVQFTGPIDPGSVSPACINVTPLSGAPIPGAMINPNSDGLGFTWTPPYPGLSASTTYTVAISGVLDLDGMPVTPSVTTFTTGTSSNYGPGTVSITPASGALNVSPNTNIVITLGAPIDPVSTSNLSISTAAGTPILGTWAVSGNLATFTPALPYPSAAVIQILGSLATNTGAGVWMSQSFTVQYYSSNVPAFTVVGISPANNMTGVSPYAPIVIRVSEPIANLPSNAVQVFNGDQFVYSSVALSSDHKTITVQPSNLTSSAVITVVVTSSVADLYGTGIAPFTSRFTVAPSASPSAFFVTTTRPAQYTSAVPSNVQIGLLLNRAGIDQASVQSSLLLTANGSIIEATATFPDPELIEIVPSVPLPAGSIVNLSLNAQDIYGNPLSFSGLSFSVAGPGPQPAQVIANSYGWLQSGSSVPVIELEYDQPLLASSLGPNNFVLQELWNGPTVPVTVTFAGVSNNVLVITPQAPLLPIPYQLLPGSQAIQGANGLPAQSFSYTSFQFPNQRVSTPARIIGTLPDNNWNGVGTNVEMTLAFDAPIDEVSVSAGTLKLSSGQQSIPLNWSFSFPYSSGIIIDPVQFLTPNTTYTLSYAGLVDTNGNAVATGSVTFTTGPGIDDGAPQLLSISPSGQSLPLNSSVVLHFDKAIATYPFALSALEPGASWTFSPDHKTATFSPVTPWPPNSNISVAGVPVDETGVAYPNTIPSFTTGYAANTTAPSVTGTNPQPGASGLPRNLTIQVAFTTALSPSTLGGIALATAAGPVSSAPSLSPDGTSLFVQPAVLLSANTSYQLTVAGVTDTEGHPIAAPYVLKFTTGAGTLAPGNIVAENPTGQPPFLGPLSPVTIFYSQPVNPLTVSSNNFGVFELNSFERVPVDGTLSVAPNGMSITFVPDQPWTPGSTYSIDPGNEVQILDIAGNPLPRDYTWEFISPAVLSAGTQAVSSVSPANNATAPANAEVQLLFTDNVDPGTVSPATVSITSGSGKTPAGTLSISGPLVTFTLMPGTTWSSGAQYTVHVSGVTNESGIVAPAFTSTFTAAAATASPNFSITAVSPANGNTLSSNTTPVVITFSEPPDPFTVASGFSISEFYPQNGPIAGAWSVRGNTATFTPSSPYPPNATIEVGGGGTVTDLAGDPLSSGVLFPVSFITAAGSDTTAFKLVSISPANGASQIGLTPSVTLHFSQSVATGTLNGIALYQGDALAPFMSSYSPDGRTVVLTPGTNWYYNPGAVMTVVGTANVKDVSGNSLQPFESKFSLISSAQENGPVVQSVRPGTGATSVPANAPVSFFVSGSPLNAATVAGAVHVYQNGIPASGTARLVESNIIEFTGTAPWAAGAVISTVVDTSLADVNGHTLGAQFESSFTIAAAAAATPQLLLTNFGSNYTVPPNGRLELLFDQPLEASSVTTSALTLFDSGAQMYVGFNAELAGTNKNIVIITPASGFTPSDAYTLYAGTTSLRSAAGAVYPAPAQYGSFWTGSQATNGIAVSQVDPPNSYPVPTNAAIRVSFSGQADPLTVNPQNITLQAGGQTQPYSLTLPVYNIPLVLTPLAPLPPNTAVTVSITGVTDMAGNPIASTTSQFLTGATPGFNGPQLLGTEPAPNTTVPTNTKVFSLLFNEAIDPNSITASTITVQENYSNIPGVISQSPDGKTVFFTTSQPLTPGGQVTLSYGSLTDLAGNAASCCYYSDFTVGTSAVASPLLLTGSVPGPNWRSVPVNVNLELFFSAPPDMTSLSGVQLLQGSTSIPVTPVLNQANPPVILLQTASLLNANQNYILSIAGVRDVAGNPLGHSESIPFVTGTSANLGPFTGTMIAPANPLSASPTTSIEVQFSAPVNPSSVSISFEDSNYQPVPVSFSLSSDGMTATWTPLSTLSAGNYMFSMSAVDDAGNYLSSNLYTVITVP